MREHKESHCPQITVSLFVTLKELVETSIWQNVGFATLWALLLAICEEFRATLATNMMAAVTQVWL